MILPYDAEGGIPKVVANKLAVLASGAWILPFWREPGKTCPKLRSEVKDPKDIVRGSAGVLISGDQGLTWRVRGNLTSPGTWLIENTVVELGSRELLQHFRTRKGVAYSSVSRDGGETWSSPQRTSIPNPNSKMHTIRVSNAHPPLAALRGAAGSLGARQDGDGAGRLVDAGAVTGRGLLAAAGTAGKKSEDGGDHTTPGGATGDPTPLLLAAYNHHPRLRAPLVLARSRDNGNSWGAFAVLETPTATLLQFSYPTMLATARGTIAGGGRRRGCSPRIAS